MSSSAQTSDPTPATPRFLPVHGRWRAYDRVKQWVKRLSPDWFVRTVQAVAGPVTRARNLALHRRLIAEKLPEAIHEPMLEMYHAARARWNRGERTPTGPLLELPLGRSPHKVSLRPGTCDIILLDDIVVHEQYGSLPLERVRTIVDVGANIGLASAYFLWRAPQARVIALEPDPVNHELCLRNLAAFGDRAVVLRAGLWSEPCRIQVEPANLGTWASTVVPVPTAAGSDTIEALDMPTLLDRYGIERLDLLKIDIEGAEREVFAAGDLSWLDRVGCIQIELEEPSRDTFFRALHGRGFEFLRHGEVTVAARPNWAR
jgi:FkbM family methyltransferase